MTNSNPKAAEIREGARSLADTIRAAAPDSPERDHALDELATAARWAEAALAGAPLADAKHPEGPWDD